MYADITKPPEALPQPNLKKLDDEGSVLLLNPLSRRGRGPGLLLLVQDSPPQDRLSLDNGVPSPLMKWAEEGYTVVEISQKALTGNADVIKGAVDALKSCDKYEDTGKIGLVAYNAQVWNQAASLVTPASGVSGVVIYGDQGDDITTPASSIPVLRHLAGQGKPLTRTPSLTTYSYPSVKSHHFANPFSEDFTSSAEAVSHSRNLTFLKPLVGGPYFDLEHIWDEHTYYEFADRSVEHTMSTMVQEPYVNHVPTLTGGVGRKLLSAFYRDHFIFNNSSDANLDLISRTVGIDRVVDEFLFCCTHDLEIDWLIPGIPPTGKKLQIPFTAVVNIRGDRLYHEHIAWDQGTVLAQLGLMPEYLPFPYALPDGKVPAEGGQFEFKVPVAGIDTANKMRDKASVPSNVMFSYKVREVKK